ncbi:MAG: twin-arginine translocation signal domain-containing protein [Chloroflexi bacterium]|nr:twin-arginine translocation signal domain-containing protein [Chloroflexota bacterium]
MTSKKSEANKGGENRRSFLAKLGVGIAAMAGVSAGLVKFGGKPENSTSDFPGPDSIFHPAQDPRQDPRRQS